MGLLFRPAPRSGPVDFPRATLGQVDPSRNPGKKEAAWHESCPADPAIHPSHINLLNDQVSTLAANLNPRRDSLKAAERDKIVEGGAIGGKVPPRGIDEMEGIPIARTTRIDNFCQFGYE